MKITHLPYCSCLIYTNGNMYSLATIGSNFFSIFWQQKIEEINPNRLAKLIKSTLGKKNSQLFCQKTNKICWEKKTLQVGSGY
jgi:hypothetical protein